MLVEARSPEGFGAALGLTIPQELLVRTDEVIE